MMAANPIQDLPRKRTRGMERLLDVLDYVGNTQRPVSPSEIATQLSAPRSTIYEIVELLLHREYLERDSKSGNLTVGRKAYLIGTTFGRHVTVEQIVRPVLANLSERTGEISELCVIKDWQQLVMFAVEGKREFYFMPKEGALFPLPRSAAGRFLITTLDPKSIRRNIPAEQYQMADGSRLTLRQMLDQSQHAVERGYATIKGAVDPYISCIAAPVYDSNQRCIASVSLVMPLGEVEKREKDLAAAVQDAAETIAQDLSRAGLKL
jgi:DNA-binding IclR family transcriptional regulator